MSSGAQDPQSSWRANRGGPFTQEGTGGRKSRGQSVLKGLGMGVGDGSGNMGGGEMGWGDRDGTWWVGK